MKRKNITTNEIRLTCAGFLHLTRLLADKISSRYRTWLMIGMNGFRVGAALYGRAKPDIIKHVNLAYLRARHYRGRRRQKQVLLSPIVGKIEEPVLIIDDIIDSGETIQTVRKKLRGSKSGIAVLFKKTWTPLKPNYYLQETDKWIIFPWE